MTTLNETAGIILRCPSCQQRGKKVKPSTLHALLQEEYREDVIGYEPDAVDACGCTPPKGNTGYRFCDSAECDVVYFSETDGRVFTKTQLRVTVGVKEKTGDRPLCYCFGHSVASIKDELRTKGESDALDDIRQKMENPGCRCETENPSGSCCLGSVTKGITTAQEELEMSEPVVLPTNKASNSLSSRGETVAKVGTVVSAIMASSCCWLPLVLLAVGVSGVGIASTLEAYRPLFIVGTFSFLGTAFYYTYRPKKSTVGGEHDCCATGEVEDCCSPAAKRRQNMMTLNKVMLWVVTVLAVAFLLFPSYVGAFLGGDGRTVSASMNRSVLTIEGMTCEGCSAIAAKAIRGVPGVVAVEVSYENGQVVVGTEARCSVPQEKILAALESAGYHGNFVPSEGNLAKASVGAPQCCARPTYSAGTQAPATVDDTTLLRTAFMVEGMICEGCAAGIANSIRSVPGVVDVEVDFDSDKAVVATTGPVPTEQIIAAIETAGFEGEVLDSVDKNTDLDKSEK